MAVEFSGVDSQWVDWGVTPATDLAQKTIISQFRLTTLVTLGDILSKVNLSGTDVGWFTTVGSDGRFYFDNLFGSGVFGGWRTNTGVITTNTQYRVLVTYDNSSASNDPVIYVNGVSVTVNEYLTPSGTTSSDATAHLRIGDAESSGAGGTNTSPNGIIEAGLIYNRIFSSQEISEDYNSKLAISTIRGIAFAPKLIGATGLQTFDGTTLAAGNTIIDSVSGAFGVPSGSPVGRGDIYLNY